MVKMMGKLERKLEVLGHDTKSKKEGAAWVPSFEVPVRIS